ncbi:YbaB/EbfC family nucleoid-associated protein [Saccharopolyspora sp. ASAGF58]|uniref:YbaB/EbfC family nucleoid-associated protein n=1 Tax=Saccharopolyspora sp. ASAGF58 TaxID=2719023 RepID=UPI00144610EF|nr:YbaB/EbfC family nucleoid-associated protein [Saccharopolyspora sp. ASAGF58]
MSSGYSIEGSFQLIGLNCSSEIRTEFLGVVRPWPNVDSLQNEFTANPSGILGALVETHRVDFEALRRAADDLERRAKEIRRARGEHERHNFSGRSGSGRVVATCLGNGTVTEIAIRGGVLSSIYPETVAAEIKDAIGKARSRASEAASRAFKKVAPDLAGGQ